MVDDFWMDGSDRIVVNDDDQPIDCSDAPCGDVATPCDELCLDTVAPFVFSLVAAFDLGGNLTYSPTAKNGVDPGWLYDVAPGSTPVCTGFPNLSLRTILLWCDGAGWQMEIVVVQEGSQFSYSTETGSLDPITILSPISPRRYTTQTPANVSACGFSRQLRVVVRVKA